MSTFKTRYILYLNVLNNMMDIKFCEKTVDYSVVVFWVIHPLYMCTFITDYQNNFSMQLRLLSSELKDLYLSSNLTNLEFTAH